MIPYGGVIIHDEFQKYENFFINKLIKRFNFPFYSITINGSPWTNVKSFLDVFIKRYEYSIPDCAEFLKRNEIAYEGV